MKTPPRRAAAPAPDAGWSEAQLHELQGLLDAVPSPLEPLDVSMLDGYLCGVLVQPQRIPESRWLPHVTDTDGRPLPRSFDPARLHQLVRRRHAELDAAIARRAWFDPWVFELDDADGAHPPEAADEEPPAVEAVYPWVAGFAAAMELFPALLDGDAAAVTEPLALLYRHLDAEDLEDAESLIEEMESLEPPADLTEAVEELVRATLLLADVGRPVPRPGRPPARGGGRRRG